MLHSGTGIKLLQKPRDYVYNSLHSSQPHNQGFNKCFLIIMMKYVFSCPMNTVNQMQQWCLTDRRAARLQL